ncbi:MAG: hypothetical protein NTY12_04455 [Candidatus Falkowbacteria bacterium]|nr:hypothetical protein [Candidatus Falkowbacteria bacterium]
MSVKKSFDVYYLLVSEGTTEYNLFSYLTKNRYRELFAKSNIKFSDKVDIASAGISRGKLDGAGNLSDFENKFRLIKNDGRYKGQKLFFVLDKDLDDSPAIEDLVRQSGDIVQFIEFNSEHLMLNFAGKDPRNPAEFSSLVNFRAYCKDEFQRQFNKKASELKDHDFDAIFNGVTERKIRSSFIELFATLSEQL